MVEQSGEPLLLSFPCCFPHTVQSLGHALPALCRVHVRLNDVLPRLFPSLPSLRDLITRIHQFVEPYNQICRPFCLDRYRRFPAPETCTPMWIYFRTTHSS